MALKYSILCQIYDIYTLISVAFFFYIFFRNVYISIVHVNLLYVVVSIRQIINECVIYKMICTIHLCDLLCRTVET